MQWCRHVFFSSLCPNEMSSPGVEPGTSRQGLSAYCMATRCHLPPGTFCIVSVIAGQAGQQRWQGSRVQTPLPSFFLLSSWSSCTPCTQCDPSLALHAGSCGLMDKALAFGTKDCRFESCQDQVFLSAIRCPCIPWCCCSVRPRSACLASPGLTLLLTFCTAMEKVHLARIKLATFSVWADVIATRPQVLLLHTSKAHRGACLKNDNRCCCKFTKWPRASAGLKISKGFAMSEQMLQWKLSASMDRLGIAPRAFRVRSGCDTTTPCAPCSRTELLTVCVWQRTCLRSSFVSFLMVAVAKIRYL